ncbi:MAG: hypothetical protein ACSHX8_04430 [Opitutaceae bacterium]
MKLKELSLWIILALGVSAFALTGCDDNNLEDAADEVGDAVEDGADAVKDGIHDAADAVKDATN